MTAQTTIQSDKPIAELRTLAASHRPPEMMQRSARSLLLKSLASHPTPNPALHRSPSIPKFPGDHRNPNRPTVPIRPIASVRPSHLWGHAIGCRGYSGEAGDYGREVDEINLKFAEAREEIDAAMESKETVYFDEEAECAREAVKVVLDLFGGLLARLPESERMALQRSMGLKMEQLKAELKQLEE